jgi:hypothetical protein
MGADGQSVPHEESNQAIKRGRLLRSPTPGGANSSCMNLALEASLSAIRTGTGWTGSSTSKRLVTHPIRSAHDLKENDIVTKQAPVTFPRFKTDKRLIGCQNEILSRRCQQRNTMNPQILHIFLSSPGFQLPEALITNLNPSHR